MIKIIGSSKDKITKYENGANAPHLEIIEAVSVHCNIVKNHLIIVINHLVNF